MNKANSIDDDLKVGIQFAIDRFLKDDSVLECDFPSSFTGAERAYIHTKCNQMGLISKSSGKRTNRYLMIRKKQPHEVIESPMMFKFGQSSRRILHTLLSRWPMKQKEKQDIQPKLDQQIQAGHFGYRSDLNKPSGRLPNGIPQIPVKCSSTDFDQFQKSLPVHDMKDVIVKTIWDNSVVLIYGESGVGKTTQIPQFILNESFRRNEVCRIVCTQPQRISAVAMAERVALECGEGVGQTVGYQIRLESRASPRTLLTFCTNGVLLRTLMAGDSAMQNITHVIVDEVHERDRFNDFLLIKLRKLMMSQKSQFRLILMSASIDVKFLLEYFALCPFVKIPGKLFEVEELYLEDILSSTGYLDKNVEELQKEMEKRELQKQQLNKWLSELKQLEDLKEEKVCDEIDVNTEVESLTMDKPRQFMANEPKRSQFASLDKALHDAWHFGTQEIFDEIVQLVTNQYDLVNYCHAETGVTALMTLSVHGALAHVEQVVTLGADPSRKAPNGMSAIDMARQRGHNSVVELLDTLSESCDLSQKSLVNTDELLAYYDCKERHQVDYDLIMTILRRACSCSDEGGILVYLPGYDDIIGLRCLIMDDSEITASTDIRLFTLHAGMQSSELKSIFKAMPSGTRKIILSTSLAESTVAINDIVFVIDSGKILKKMHDPTKSITSLKYKWISRASAIQRAGKAGVCRPGVCYRLYSQAQFSSMTEYQTPELLCTPLHELCLHVKLLDETASIAQFFQQAPSSPSVAMVNGAVNLLKTMDALDQFEHLTELGQHLVDLPIEPRLGKMILYSVVLKCLDPILTIACSLSYKDPFVIPHDTSSRIQAMESKIKFAAGTFSDHMCLLRAFQAWQKARSDGWEKNFCQSNFMSQAAMEKIVGMRTQLLGQLRATGFVRARGGSDIRDLNTNSENWAVVKAALCASVFPNLLRVDRKFKAIRSKSSKRVCFHHTSVLARPLHGKNETDRNVLEVLPSDWMIFDEMSRATNSSFSLVTCCTVISPACIALFAGPVYLSENEVINDPEIAGNPDGYPPDSDSESDDVDMGRLSTLAVTDWIKLTVEPPLARMIVQLRTKWFSLFARRIRNPSKPWQQEDEAVLTSIINILGSEDQRIGLTQPSGIGQRPRPVTHDDGGRSSQLIPRTPGSGKGNHGGATGTGKKQPKSLNFRGMSLSAGQKPLSGTEDCIDLNEKKCQEFNKDTRSDTRQYFVLTISSLTDLQHYQATGKFETNSEISSVFSKVLLDHEVFLFFAVHGVGQLQGCGKLDDASSELTNMFNIDWLKKTPLSISLTHLTCNMWNSQVISYGLQKIDLKLADTLLQLWEISQMNLPAPNNFLS